MKNIIFLAFITIVFISCSDLNNEDFTQENLKKEKVLPFNEKLIRHIESNLEIASNEKYSYKVYKEHLDNDSILDAIISVNRLEYALEEARISGNSAKRAEIGFTGRYNC